MKRYFWITLFCVTFAIPAFTEIPSKTSGEKSFLVAKAAKPPSLNIARQFYRWNIDNAITGLPSEKQILLVQHLLDPTLSKAIQQSRTVQDCLIKLTPAGNKPPVFEGNIFVGLAEGATHIKKLKASENGNSAIITAELSNIHFRIPIGDKYRAFTWTHQLILSKKGSRWLIVDTKNESGTSVSAILASYIQEYRSTCNPN